MVMYDHCDSEWIQVDLNLEIDKEWVVSTQCTVPTKLKQTARDKRKRDEYHIDK